MDSRIELMDRRRKTLLTWLFWGFGGWYVMLLTYWIISIASSFGHDGYASHGIIASINPYFLYGGLGVAAIFLFFLARWWLYKRGLQRDPALRAAVNDEFVQQSWLKAFRFAFFCLIALFVLNFFGFFTNIFLIRSMGPKDYGRVAVFISIFSAAHFYLFVAVMSCIGSFLRFSRERS
jgi:O-antigen/teichoic acid export membrane protein